MHGINRRDAERHQRDDRKLDVVAGMLQEGDLSEMNPAHGRDTQQRYKLEGESQGIPLGWPPLLCALRLQGPKEGCNSYCVTCYLGNTTVTFKEIKTNILMCCLGNG